MSMTQALNTGTQSVLDTSSVSGEKLLVLASINSDHGYLIRAGRQIANRRGIDWTVVWVDTGQPRGGPGTILLENAFSLARELGAKTAILRGPSTLQTVLPFIEQNGFRSILVGAGTHPRFPFFHRRLYRQLIDSGLPLEVSVIRSPGSPGRLGHVMARFAKEDNNLGGFAFSAVAVLTATILALLFRGWISNVNMVLVFVLAVAITGLRHGSRPAITASLLAFLSFNFFLTNPRYTFVVASRSELFTLIFLLLIGLICGPAASRIRRQIILLQEANRSSEALRLLAQELSVAEDEAAVWLCVAGQLARILEAECCIAVPGESGQYALFPQPAPALTPTDEAVVDWSLDHLARAGRFTDVLATSSWFALPVKEEDECTAVAIFRFAPDRATGLEPPEETLVTAMLQQGADTRHRIQLAGELESVRVKSEVEQLRAALMSSVSHDLKTPLAAMMGAAESLRLLDKQLDTDDREALENTILQESRRLESYIQNLLDMTRLGYGTLNIERDWVSLADIVGSAIARLKRYFPSVTTEYRSYCQEPLLYAHAALIEQALFNILENAAKYSPADEKILISVDVQAETCVISVEDKGPGIPASLREKVFDMFYVASEGDRKHGGTGMGLAICRGMIGAHAGQVDIFDATGHRGTKVVVSLPMNYPADGTTGEDNV